MDCWWQRQRRLLAGRSSESAFVYAVGPCNSLAPDGAAGELPTQRARVSHFDMQSRSPCAPADTGLQKWQSQSKQCAQKGAQGQRERMQDGGIRSLQRSPSCAGSRRLSRLRLPSQPLCIARHLVNLVALTGARQAAPGSQLNPVAPDYRRSPSPRSSQERTVA